MTDTLQAIAGSLSSDVKTLSTISHNVANMHTPGYRGVRAVPEFGREVGMSTAIDQRDGALAQTGNELDIALRGPGFFVVERNGKMLLSRAGTLRTDAEGRLVTAAGDLAVGYSGALQIPEGAVRFERDGQVFVADRPIGQLQIVAVADPSALRSVGNGAYAYDGALAEWKGSVVQGAIEHANVDAAEETVRLMETTRHAESVQRAISIYDKAMETGINQIGN
ncbi:MAG: flagellar hook-basal body protein [Pseudomonadota bacterium]